MRKSCLFFKYPTTFFICFFQIKIYCILKYVCTLIYRFNFFHVIFSFIIIFWNFIFVMYVEIQRSLNSTKSLLYFYTLKIISMHILYRPIKVSVLTLKFRLLKRFYFFLCILHRIFFLFRTRIYYISDIHQPFFFKVDCLMMFSK